MMQIDFDTPAAPAAFADERATQDAAPTAPFPGGARKAAAENGENGDRDGINDAGRGAASVQGTAPVGRADGTANGAPALPAENAAIANAAETAARPYGNEEATPAIPETGDDKDKTAKPPAVDYAEVAAGDLEILRRTFPACAEMEDLCRLENPLRYAQLRDLGLTPEEAYLATTRRHVRPDNRSHLASSVPRAVSGGAGMTAAQLSAARELFEGLSDAELTRLYRRAVT